MDICFINKGSKIWGNCHHNPDCKETSLGVPGSNPNFDLELDLKNKYWDFVLEVVVVVVMLVAGHTPTNTLEGLKQCCIPKISSLGTLYGFQVGEGHGDCHCHCYLGKVRSTPGFALCWGLIIKVFLQEIKLI